MCRFLQTTVAVTGLALVLLHVVVVGAGNNQASREPHITGRRSVSIPHLIFVFGDCLNNQSAGSAIDEVNIVLRNHPPEVNQHVLASGRCKSSIFIRGPVSAVTERW